MFITVNRRKRPLAEIDGNTVRTYQHDYSADMPKLKKQRRTQASSRGSLQTQSLPERASNHTTPTPTPTPESDIPDTHLMVTRDDILAAAGGLLSRSRAESNPSDTDSDYNPVAGPSSKCRKKDNAEWRRRHNYRLKKATKKKPQTGTRPTLDMPLKSLSCGNPSTQSSSPTKSVTTIPDSDDSSTSIQSRTKQDLPQASSAPANPDGDRIINGRHFITLAPPRHAKTRQLHLFPDYSAPHEPFPANFTLTELCQHYPNHVIWDNLIPFMQHGWGGARITALMPDQGNVPVEERVTISTIGKRLRRMKTRLVAKGQYTTVMEGPKLHDEGAKGV